MVPGQALMLLLPVNRSLRSGSGLHEDSRTVPDCKGRTQVNSGRLGGHNAITAENWSHAKAPDLSASGIT
jgi:hypothetical protein